MPAAHSASTTRTRDRRLYGTATLIVTLGLALRLWGIGWSLPDARHPLATYHPDELVNLGAAEQVDIPHGRFDTGFYNYGAFYFYLVSLAHTVGRGYHLIPGRPVEESPALSEIDQLRQHAPERAGLFLVGRLVTVMLGTGTILVVLALGARLYGSRAGLLAAFLYAAAPLAVLHAHFLTVDVPATFFVTMALLWSARLLEDASWKQLVIAGTWCGLAAATKYTAGIVAVGPITALLIHRRRAIVAAVHPVPYNAVLRVAALLGVSVVVFLIACPGPWLNWNAFWNGLYPGSGVRYELFDHARSGHGFLFVDTGLGWWYHLTVSLRYGLGIPLLLLSAVGILVACRRRERGDWILLAFLLIAYAATSFSAVRFARYLIPLYPALCILAARSIFASCPPTTVERARKRNTTILRTAVAVIVGLATLCISAVLDRTMALPDPRDLAADYLERTAPPGASIGFAHVPWFYSPPLSPLWGALSARVRAQTVSESGRFQFRMPVEDWDKNVIEPRPDYVIVSNMELQDEWRRLRLPAAERFMRSVEDSYSARVFQPSTLSSLVADDKAPQDLLYVLPRIYVYRPKVSVR